MNIIAAVGFGMEGGKPSFREGISSCTHEHHVSRRDRKPAITHAPVILIRRFTPRVEGGQAMASSEAVGEGMRVCWPERGRAEVASFRPVPPRAGEVLVETE